MSVSPESLWEIVETQDKNVLERNGGLYAIAQNLETDLKNGIHNNTISRRITNFGTNEIPDREVRSFFDMVLDALNDNTIIILIICAILSLVLEMAFAPAEERSTAWIDGAAILFAVAIVSLVQAYSNHQQELQFAAVNRIKSVYNVAVYREGKLQQMKNTDLVVGDVVQINPGDCIPADGLLIHGEDLQIDQSSANGESVAARKDENDPFIISNTHVLEGRGTFIVICVGIHSHHGRVFQLLSDVQTQTPLQEKLEVLAAKIGLMGVVAAGLTFIALLIDWIIRNTRNHWSTTFIMAIRQPLSYFIVALTIVACAVPEGLPLAVTISLAYSMRKMMTDNNFVRHLSACETMGSATVICTDKTGTLTKNEMNVEKLIIANNTRRISKIDRTSDFSKLLSRSISVNTHAVIYDGQEIGSQTECSLLRFVKYLQYDYQQIRDSSQIEKCFQFDRLRKRMTTIEKSDNSYIIYSKGAPDELLPQCKYYMTETNQIVEIDTDFRNNMTISIDKECSYAYRTIAVCYRVSDHLPTTSEEAESNLVLLTVVCIRDSLRNNTVASIHKCQRAGIRVVMITGDHMNTAEAIARECDILQDETITVTGTQLRSMTPAELNDSLKAISVVARSTPIDKHTIVKQLKAAGEVVAVTGDGTNDVPALMAADVGLAMGKSGTDFAKEASDIVILDDDFRSIVRSVVWGRCVYNNIKRFLQFQLTANVSTLFISFVSAVFLKDTPFKAVQLLWVNLIMDSLGALALATGKPHDNLLDQKPQDRDSPLITQFMIRNIAIQAILQIVLIGSILVIPGDIEPHSQYHYTFLFNVFVFCQMFNLFNARATGPNDDILLGITDNALFFGIMIGIGLVQIILVQVAGPFFSCCPLYFHEWIYTFILAALTVPVGFITRCSYSSKAGQSLSSKGEPEDNEPLLLH